MTVSEEYGTLMINSSIVLTETTDDSWWWTLGWVKQRETLKQAHAKRKLWRHVSARACNASFPEFPLSCHTSRNHSRTTPGPIIRTIIRQSSDISPSSPFSHSNFSPIQSQQSLQISGSQFTPFEFQSPRDNECKYWNRKRTRWSIKLCTFGCVSNQRKFSEMGRRNRSWRQLDNERWIKNVHKNVEGILSPFGVLPSTQGKWPCKYFYQAPIQPPKAVIVAVHGFGR